MATACSIWPATSPNGARTSICPTASGPFKPGPLRLLKGGSWFSQARDLRPAARQSAPPQYADGYIGFRVVRLPIPDLIFPDLKTRELLRKLTPFVSLSYNFIFLDMIMYR